jgi:hypothetical protein
MTRSFEVRRTRADFAHLALQDLVDPLREHFCIAVESLSGINSTVEFELHERRDNTRTTAPLRFDNHSHRCHHPQRRGGWGVTMTGSVSAARCSGRGRSSGPLGHSILPSGSPIEWAYGAIRPSLSNSEASLGHVSALSPSARSMRRGNDAPGHSSILNQKVLRSLQLARRGSLQLSRISSDFLSGISLAVKGDALIHGPRLVARPVGSEWRTRRPSQGNIQTN